MPHDYHVVLGLIASAIGAIGYVPYYRDIFRGTTKPHPFTWLGFSIPNGITFFAQIVSGAGAGAWVSAITAVGTGGIAVLAFRRGEKDITVFDWICFAGALLGIVLWRLTNNPLSAVVIVTIADLLAFAPTFRKGFLRPYEETTTLFAISTLKYALSLFALVTFNLTTSLFPIAMAAANAAIVLMLLARRRIA